MFNDNFGYSEGCSFTEEGAPIMHLSGLHMQGMSVGISPSLQLTNIDSPNDVCYARKRQEDNYMSYVGLIICRDGIVGFGDSKTTMDIGLGTLKEDLARGRIKKVFQREKSYILATYGINELQDHDGRMIHIEDWMEENLLVYEDFHSFLSAFLEKTECNFQFKDYHFLIGAKDNLGYFVQFVRISNHEIIYSAKKRRQDIYSAGTIFYTNQTHKITLSEFQTEIAEKEIVPEVNRFIKQADETGLYNPVGIPIRTEIFK